MNNQYAVSLTYKNEATGQLAGKLVIIKADNKNQALGYVVEKFKNCGMLISHIVVHTEELFYDLT